MPWAVFVFQNNVQCQEARVNRELLERPFLASEIKQREGGNGKVLDYVEAHVVILRLNEAFDGVWDFVIKSFEVSPRRPETKCLW